MLERIRRGVVLLMLAGWSLLASAAYPDKPITIIVPWAPGGSADILGRALAAQLTAILGQPVIVDNRAGAAGNIGTNFAAKARPDGYTLLVGSMSTHVMNPYIMASMPFKGVDDFTPIAELANVVNTFVVNASLPVHDVREFIAYAKANPGKINYASGGPGSTNHISAAMLEKAAGIQMVHVPYKGGAPAVADTAAGQTQVLFSAGTQTLPHVKSGKLRLLAVTESKRSALLPDVPTVAETVPGYELAVWYGLMGPIGMPKDIVDKLNAAANQGMANIKPFMESIGVEVVSTTPQQFGELLRSDDMRYGKIIRELGIKVE